MTHKYTEMNVPIETLLDEDDLKIFQKYGDIEYGSDEHKSHLGIAKKIWSYISTNMDEHLTCSEERRKLYRTYPIYGYYTNAKNPNEVYRLRGFTESTTTDSTSVNVSIHAVVLAAYTMTMFETTIPVEDLLEVQDWNENQLKTIEFSYTPTYWKDPCGFTYIDELLEKYRSGRSD